MIRARGTADHEPPARGAFGPRDIALAMAITLAGVLPLSVGLRWLQLFVFTDYRAHFRPIIIPLGILATIIGLGMVVGPWLVRRLVRRDE